LLSFLVVVYLVLNTLIGTISLGATEHQNLSSSSSNSPVDPALTAFQEAKDRYGREPQSFEAAWQFGRACFDLAENAPSKGERARLAELGIEACKRAVATNEHSAEAYYYLGMNLGQLARTKGIGALKIVGQLKSAFMRARDLNERLENAGPDRNLGLLFRDAPSWTIGDRHEAQAHLVKAVALAPEYPDNRLELIEGYFKWGDRTSAETELEALEKLWPKLHEQFSGPKWEAQWKDWQSRFEGFQQKIEKARKKKN
jgi:tetratricopeptide (TPR) repeat protein